MPVVVICVVIFVFSSLSDPLPRRPPGNRIGTIDFNVFLHVAEFGALGFALALACWRENRRPYWVVFGLLFAVSDEVHQYFVPNRFFDWWDVVVDLVGVIAGVIFFLVVRRGVAHLRARAGMGENKFKSPERADPSETQHGLGHGIALDQ